MSRNKNIIKNSLVIVPAFNEEKFIKSVIDDLYNYFENILIINDGSSDNTIDMATSTNKCKIISHPINTGQGISLLTGVRYFLKNTNYDYLITFDADGQHKAIDAFNMLKFAKENNKKVVFGSRFISNNKKNIPKIRSIFLKFAILFERIIFGFNLTDSHNGLRVFERSTSRFLLAIKSSKMAHATEIPFRLKTNGIEIMEYPCDISYSLQKKSTSIFSSVNIISDLIQKK